jgi:hypothetical protein
VEEDQPGAEGAHAVRGQGGGRKAGFDTSKPYKFKAFKPVLPEPLGEFHSFLG